MTADLPVSAVLNTRQEGQHYECVPLLSFKNIPEDGTVACYHIGAHTHTHTDQQRLILPAACGRVLPAPCRSAWCHLMPILVERCCKRELAYLGNTSGPFIPPLSPAGIRVSTPLPPCQPAAVQSFAESYKPRTNATTKDGKKIPEMVCVQV